MATEITLSMQRLGHEQGASDCLQISSRFCRRPSTRDPPLAVGGAIAGDRPVRWIYQYAQRQRENPHAIVPMPPMTANIVRKDRPNVHVSGATPPTSAGALRCSDSLSKTRANGGIHAASPAASALSPNLTNSDPR